MAAKTANVSVRWRQQLVFEGWGAVGEGVPTVVDGDTRVATSPVELLLVAAATCTGSDVVDILRKMRIALRALDISAEGTRRDEYPRRFTAIHFQFRVSGDGVDERKVRRAVDLSFDKYCSVVASLAPDIRISYDVVIA